MCSLALLLLCMVASTTLAEDASCPCLTTDNGALDSYKFNGQLYYNDHVYPNDYGNSPSFHPLMT